MCSRVSQELGPNREALLVMSGKCKALLLASPAFLGGVLAVLKKLTGFKFTGAETSQLSILVSWLGVERTSLVQPGKRSMQIIGKGQLSEKGKLEAQQRWLS